jgi:RNA polymerase sigma-70 factor (ECF subfamily)
MTRRRKDRHNHHTSVETARERHGHEPADERASADPGDALHREERQQLVRKALGELAEEYRTALILKEMDGLQYDEIAKIVNCPIGTVRSRIHRARQELREKLSRALKSEA